MRSFRAASIATGLSLVAARPVAAQIDPDFVPTLRTQLEACTGVAWYQVNPLQGGANTICSTAIVTTGRSTVTGLWGGSVDFFYTVAGHHPSFVTHNAWISGVQFTGLGPDACCDIALGSAQTHIPMALGTTIYRSYLTADSRPIAGFGMSWSITNNEPGAPKVHDPQLYFQVTQVTAIPEPATVVLVGVGVLVLGAGASIRRRLDH